MAVFEPKFRNYGLRIITGTFGAGKTKNTYLEAYYWKKQNPNGILIGNVPYDFCDFIFSSPKDLDTILSFLINYIKDTNLDDIFKTNVDFPPIRLIIDEAHTYFFSRDFKKFNKDALVILTQCRKRNIAIDFITQELAQIDIVIRRLMPYVSHYQNMLSIITRQQDLYFRTSESTDIGDEYIVEVVHTRRVMFDGFRKLIHPFVKNFYKQKTLTRYVVGLGGVDMFNRDYKDFKYNILHSLLSLPNGQVSEYLKEKLDITPYTNIDLWNDTGIDMFSGNLKNESDL